MAGFVTRMKDAWNAFNSVESDHLSRTGIMERLCWTTRHC